MAVPRWSVPCQYGRLRPSAVPRRVHRIAVRRCRCSRLWVSLFSTASRQARSPSGPLRHPPLSKKEWQPRMPAAGGGIRQRRARARPRRRCGARCRSLVGDRRRGAPLARFRIGIWSDARTSAPRRTCWRLTICEPRSCVRTHPPARTGTHHLRLQLVCVRAALPAAVADAVAAAPAALAAALAADDTLAAVAGRIDGVAAVVAGLAEDAGTAAAQREAQARPARAKCGACLRMHAPRVCAPLCVRARVRAPVVQIARRWSWGLSPDGPPRAPLHGLVRRFPLTVSLTRPESHLP